MDYWLKEGFNRKLNFCKCDGFLPPHHRPVLLVLLLLLLHRVAANSDYVESINWQKKERRNEHTHTPNKSTEREREGVDVWERKRRSAKRVQRKSNKKATSEKEEEWTTHCSICSVCLPLKLYQTSKQININSLSLWNAGAHTRNIAFMHSVRKTAYTIHTTFFVFFRVAFFCVCRRRRENCRKIVCMTSNSTVDMQKKITVYPIAYMYIASAMESNEQPMKKLERVGRRARGRRKKSNPNDQFTFERFKPSFILFRPRTIHSAHLLLPTKPFECVCLCMWVRVCVDSCLKYEMA